MDFVLTQRCMMKNGIIKVYYGDGKGKTTAAIGQGIMAASEERSVIIIQFLKSRNREEMSFISRLEPEIKLFRFEKSDACFADLTPEQKADEKANLRNGMNFARKVLSTGECNVLILSLIHICCSGHPRIRTARRRSHGWGTDRWRCLPGSCTAYRRWCLPRCV